MACNFLLYFVMGMEPRAVYMLGEHFVTGIAIPQSHMVHILKYADTINSRPFINF